MSDDYYEDRVEFGDYSHCKKSGEAYRPDLRLEAKYAVENEDKLGGCVVTPGHTRAELAKAAAFRNFECCSAVSNNDKTRTVELSSDGLCDLNPDDGAAYGDGPDNYKSGQWYMNDVTFKILACAAPTDPSVAPVTAANIENAPLP